MRPAKCLGFLLFLLLTPLPASSEPMPPETQNRLEEILRRSEFQPRSADADFLSRLIQSIKAEAGALVMRLVRRVSEWFDGITLPQLDDDSLVAKFISVLQSIFGFLAQSLEFLMYAVGAVIIAIVAYSLAKAFWPEFTAQKALTHIGKSTGNRAEKLAVSSLELVASKQYLAALEQLRREIRRDLSRRYALKDSLTDREMKRFIASDDPSALSVPGIFQMFEAVAFAGQRFEERAFLKLWNQYTAAADNRRG